MQSAARFFDDDRYLRTVVAEKSPAKSAAEARGAVELAGCVPGALVLGGAMAFGLIASGPELKPPPAYKDPIDTCRVPKAATQ